MNKVLRVLRTKDVGAIGIGAMIVFIAMVLVAGIAASVLIQTSTKLESQAMSTGKETTDEVSTGLDVYDAEGEVLAASSNKIDKLVIMVRPRAGSQDIDLSQVVVELTDGSDKYILNYSVQWFQASPATAGVFATSAFGDADGGEFDAVTFGVIELKDADESCSGSTPVINRGDKVFITVNATTTMGSIDVRKNIWGRVVPEHGAPGVISFRTPASFSDTVYDLQ